MKLRLIFLGEEQVPGRLIADFLKQLDRRLAAHEAKIIDAVAKNFPGMEFEAVRETVRKCAKDFRDDYKKGSFSMLQVVSIQRGSVDIWTHLNNFAEILVVTACWEVFKKSLSKSNSFDN